MTQPSQQEPDEKQLIEAAKQGDQSAMAALVRQHQGRIYNLALRLMSNPEDAEDVLQETFVIMIQKLHTFSGKSTLYTWLYRVATNVALGKLRRKKHVDDYVSVHEPEFEHIRGYDIHHWPDHLEEKVDDEQIRDCLEQAMELLPENYREVFVLRDLENMSTRETAKVLDLTEANVKVRLMRARLILRDQIANHLKCIEGIPYES